MWEDPLELRRADWVDDNDDLHYSCPVCWTREFGVDEI